jgi:hypothetical protein
VCRKTGSIKLAASLVLLTALAFLHTFPAGRAARAGAVAKADAAYTPRQDGQTSVSGGGAAPRGRRPNAPTTAQLGLPVEPLLNDLAMKVTATSDRSGDVKAGETFNVKLDLPKGGSARRRDSIRRIPPRRIPVIGRTVSSRNLVDDIPCELLPTGCPGPIIEPGTGGTPGSEFKDFQLHAKWGIYQSINGKRGPALVEDKDFKSPASQGAAQAFVLNALHKVVYTGATPPPKPFVVMATVSVTATKTVLSVPPSTTKVTSDEFDVEVPVSLAALEVPTVFVLFLDKNFGGAAAVYFPANTAFRGSSQVARNNLLEVTGNLLDTYNSSASKLSTFAGMASFLTGLGVLNDALSLPHVSVKELKDAESNLNDDDFIHRSATSSLNDTEVEDESSSLLLIGVEHTGVQFFQHRDFKGMRFTARTGPEMAVLIRDLSAMSSEPRDRVFDKTFTDSGTPHDCLSSFKWQR